VWEREQTGVEPPKPLLPGVRALPTAVDGR